MSGLRLVGRAVALVASLLVLGYVFALWLAAAADDAHLPAHDAPRPTTPPQAVVRIPPGGMP